MSGTTRLSNELWKFWLGQTISNLGTSFTQFALPLLVFKLTGSALNLAITTAATFLPYLLFGLVIGAWVDRVDRKKLMIATDIARAAVIASIPLLASMDRLSVEWIYVDLGHDGPGQSRRHDRLCAAGVLRQGAAPRHGLRDRPALRRRQPRAGGAVSARRSTSHALAVLTLPP